MGGAQQIVRVSKEHAQQCNVAVKKALRDGTLTRQPCAVCGKEKTVAHHDDYGKPLEVIWLCGKHHRARHKEIGQPLVYGTLNLRMMPQEVVRLCKIRASFEGIIPQIEIAGRETKKTK